MHAPPPPRSVDSHFFCVSKTRKCPVEYEATTVPSRAHRAVAGLLFRWQGVTCQAEGDSGGGGSGRRLAVAFVVSMPFSLPLCVHLFVVVAAASSLNRAKGMLFGSSCSFQRTRHDLVAPLLCGDDRSVYLDLDNKIQGSRDA